MASGWWDDSGAISGCVAAYQPIGAASLAASYSNLQNPGTYDASPGTAPSFDTATGWTFNGSTQYLTTGITPANDQTWSIIARYSGWGGAAHAAVISTSTFLPAWIGLYSVWDSQGIFINGSFAFNGAAVTGGVQAIAGSTAYVDGVQRVAGLGAGSGSAGALRIALDALGQYASGSIQAIAVYSAVLTAGNVATLTTSMNALVASSQSIVPHLAAHTDWWHG